MTHKIKIKKKYYDAVLSGDKIFEVRKNDRDYKVGDIIQFVPVADDGNMIIPHNTNEYKITYVFHGGEYGLEEGYCVFGIAPTIKAVPVVHGKWENVGDDEEDLCFRCTNCKAEFSCEIDMRQFAKYCPECGAKMKRGAE